VAALGTILTAIATPFDSSLAVDEESFVALQRHVCGHGSDGVVACGSTGEAATLADDEHLRVVELAVSEKPEGTKVVAGTGSNDTAHAVWMTEKATELGVDAVLVVTPYYVRPNRRGILRHYEEVAKATDKPVILYNIPLRTGTDMPNDLLAELAQIENVTGVKQANNDNLALVDGLDVYAGNDDIFARTLDMGGAGIISVASHLVGDMMRRMVDEPEQRAELDAELQDVVEALFSTANPIPLKAALEMLGLIRTAGLRLPLIEADEDERAVVRSMLERRGLLEAARR
jgi:4-hydroxy-tetrahydrodipicolinate synthase